MKAIGLVSMALLLSACQSIVSLTDKPGALKANEHAIATAMQDKTIQNCIISRSFETPGQPAFAGGKIWDRPVILRLYTATNNSGWWKADILYNSVWDSIFFNRKSDAFVCGSEGWIKRSSEADFTLLAPK